MALTDEEQRYARAWTILRVALVTCIGAISVAGFLALSLGTLQIHATSTRLGLPILILFSLSLVVAVCLHYLFRCPRCAKRFFGSLILHSRRKNCCAHCELRAF